MFCKAALGETWVLLQDTPHPIDVGKVNAEAEDLHREHAATPLAHTDPDALPADASAMG